MAVRRAITGSGGLYFITITCARWLPLFEMGDCYDVVYKWFKYLTEHGHYIVGYVIMPNHLHVIIGFRNTRDKSVNMIVGNGKRFMAYAIVSKLKASGANKILDQLSSYVKEAERVKGKLHEIFEPSFDSKECYSDWFIEQKLNYIHQNPIRGKWALVNDPWEYVHSSALFYLMGRHAGYPVVSYAYLKDVDLSRSE